MTRAAAEPECEVWLRANVRPAAVLAAVALVAGTALAVLAALPSAPPVARLCAGVASVAAALPLVALAAAAARPRLVRRGRVLRVRLAPLLAHDVPLDVVECFFLGSQRLPGGGDRDDLPTHRVGTIVMRIAERAAAWQARPTFPAWGTWAEGAVVFDGRWCEPLSADLVRRLTARLVDAQRRAGEAP